jgi:hypothetical protein
MRLCVCGGGGGLAGIKPAALSIGDKNGSDFRPDSKWWVVMLVGSGGGDGGKRVCGFGGKFGRGCIIQKPITARRITAGGGSGASSGTSADPHAG